jgi:hypothetical protein
MGFFVKVGKVSAYSTKKGAKVSFAKPTKKTTKKK